MTDRPFEVRYEKSPLKTFRRLPRGLAGRIDQAIEALAYEPHPTGSRKIEGYDIRYRIRVGDWRIIYDIYTEEAVLAVSLLAVSIPLHIAQLRQICNGPNCASGQLTRVELQVHERAGWSLGTYIIYDLALNTFVVLVFFALAVILFRRKLDDWMAIYVSFVFLIFPLGTINISARRNGADYTATDRETLEKIAQVVAEAIDQDTESILREVSIRQ